MLHFHCILYYIIIAKVSATVAIETNAFVKLVRRVSCQPTLMWIYMNVVIEKSESNMCLSPEPILRWCETSNYVVDHLNLDNIIFINYVKINNNIHVYGK